MNHTCPSFLEEVFQDLYQKYQVDIANSIVIFPNKKAAEAFQQVIRNSTHHLPWLPHVLTLEAWIIQHSKITLAPTLNLVVLLYQIFQQFKPSQEPFERFYGWGYMLLQDFDIIDKCLVNPEELFTNLYEQKALTVTHEHLTDLQKEAIKSFWKTFDTHLSTHQQGFLQIWKLLPQVYKNFTNYLLEKGMGYPGLCYRKLCHNLGSELLANYQRIAIVGFNALHPAEEKLFAWLHSHISTEFYWDTDAYYMYDEAQEAGRYLRAHQVKSYFQTSFKAPFPARIQTMPKKISLYELNTEVGQVQLVSAQLQQLFQEQGNSLRPHQAVIVLANEDLLLPMLYALPTNLPIHTSLGYPIAQTASYQFIEQLLALQIAIRQPTCPAGYFPTPMVITLLQQILIRDSNRALATQTIQTLTHTYTSYVSQKVLAACSDLYQAIFKQIPAGTHIIPYMLDLLSLLITQLTAAEHTLLSLEKQALTQVQEQFGHLKHLIDLLSDITPDRFLELFRQLIQPIRLPLGEKTAADGIPIVRIWETANLDFEHVFIVGMNEGALPASTTQGSFIPYNLRKGYGLPTMDTFQASLDAYYFYRLLQRAQHVYITYSTPSGANTQKEMSRYVWQLLYESNLPIEKKPIHATIYTPTTQPIIIKKDTAILESLKKFIVQPGQATRTFTSTALNTYLDCSLRFYFHYILKLPVPQPRSPKEAEAMLFGNLLHEVMEKLYTPLQTPTKDRPISAHDIGALHKQVPAHVAQVFLHTFYQGAASHWAGQHMIEQEVMQKVVHRILTIDEKKAPFILLGLELGKQEPFVAHCKINKSDQMVSLQGTIDRIELKQDSIHIIDYKTGSDEKYVATISHLFHRNAIKRNKAIFQLFLYAWLFKQNSNQAAYKIVPHLINMRAIFKANFDARLMIQSVTTQGYTYIEDIVPYQNEFEAGLSALVAEIVDPHIPFLQTENRLHCIKCPYNKICQRH